METICTGVIEIVGWVRVVTAGDLGVVASIVEIEVLVSDVGSNVGASCLELTLVGVGGTSAC